MTTLRHCLAVSGVGKLDGEWAGSPFIFCSSKDMTSLQCQLRPIAGASSPAVTYPAVSIQRRQPIIGGDCLFGSNELDHTRTNHIAKPAPLTMTAPATRHASLVPSILKLRRMNTTPTITNTAMSARPCVIQ